MSLNSHSEVTVVIPSYNSGKYLETTLESVKKQTFFNFECIVVDDCSSQKISSHRISFFKDSRFHLIEHKMNMGPSGARNTGIRAARSPFIVFLDSDDLMMPNSLEVRYAACKKALKISEKFAGSYCGSIQIQEKDTTPPRSTVLTLPYIDFVSSKGICPFNANQPMLRTDLLRQSGGFNMGLKQAEDFDIWIRILRAGYIFAPANYCSVTYRKRQNSHIRSAPINHLENSLAIIQSSERGLHKDQLAWSKFRFEKNLSSYSYQKKVLPRIFEFCGMAIAGSKKTEINNLIKIVNNNLPDLSKIVTEKNSILKHMENGIKRQIDSVTDDLIEECDNFLNIAFEKLLDTSKANETILSSHIYGDEQKDRIWFSSSQKKYSIIFIPHKDYHVWTISLLKDEFQKMGVEFIVVDISAEWRDAGIRRVAEEFNIKLLTLSEFILSNFEPKVLVVFNDWDPITRPILVAARAAGIKTIAIVEGIQDYDDVDVHWTRHAYKTADLILLPGDFDKKYFRNPSPEVMVAGVPRIHDLRIRPKRSWNINADPKVLINCNFSYGVLEENRDKWLKDVVCATINAGMSPVISRHPGDKGQLFPEFTSDKSFYELLEICVVSVQRFASGILEALAREVGVIYYNPHGEKVDKFQMDSMGAYEIEIEPSGLKSKLLKWNILHEMARDFGPKFLDSHAGKISDNPINKCANIILENSCINKNIPDYESFKKYLEVLDFETRAFYNPKPNGVPLFPDPSNAIEKMSSLFKKHQQKLENVLQNHEFNKNKTNTAVDTNIRISNSEAANISDENLTSNFILIPSSFAQANKLYRDGKYAQALNIYKALHAKEPLEIYQTNANMCLVKLGLMESGINS